MNKTLVIINGTYPYQRSEDYLANEVNLNSATLL